MLASRQTCSLSFRLARLSFYRYYAKTSTDNPSNLTQDDIGKIYQIPLEATKALAFEKILPSKFNKQVNTMDDCSILCRQQFLEVINCLNVVRPSLPSIRVVLWGKFGTGKTLTLAQTIHFAQTQNWVIFNVKDVMNWTRKVKDVQSSVYKPGRIDLPEYSVDFLQHFKQQNQHVWKTLSGLNTERTYEWTKVEKTMQDRPITEIVEMGIASPLVANDCVGALCRELRRHSTSGAIRLLVALDGGNSLYGKTLIKKADRSFAVPEELSLIYQVKKFLKDDWTNGLVLMIADKREVVDARDTLAVPIDTPIELFTEQGFEDIDPFIPIETKLYSENEARIIHEYYKEKNWLITEEARSDKGLRELHYLAAYNPYYFERLCAFN
uniref:Small ribosomal subunit protein mS29 n=1 Tax=Panagrolaimus superbus TaxID=310955 RepID=A0A914Z7R0_9BILA